MLLGYLHPEDDAEAFDSDGYFRTGDLGAWVDGDYLVVTGRAKDIIIRNGENISPKEIEDLLIAEPGIAEIAIVGLPDPRTGERACAVIVPMVQRPPGVDGATYCARGSRGGEFKVPERVEIWDALPKNDAGKVLKHQIRAALMEGAGHAGSDRHGGKQRDRLRLRGQARRDGDGSPRRRPRRASGWPTCRAIGDPERVATVAVDLTADDGPRKWSMRRCPGGVTSTS